MQLTNEQLLQLLGQKEIDLYATRLQLQQLLQQVEDLEAKLKDKQNG